MGSLWNASVSKYPCDGNNGNNALINTGWVGSPSDLGKYVEYPFGSSRRYYIIASGSSHCVDTGGRPASMQYEAREWANFSRIGNSDGGGANTNYFPNTATIGSDCTTTPRPPGTYLKGDDGLSSIEVGYNPDLSAADSFSTSESYFYSLCVKYSNSGTHVSSDLTKLNVTFYITKTGSFKIGYLPYNNTQSRHIETENWIPTAADYLGGTLWLWADGIPTGVDFGTGPRFLVDHGADVSHQQMYPTKSIKLTGGTEVDTADEVHLVSTNISCNGVNSRNAEGMLGGVNQWVGWGSGSEYEGSYGTGSELSLDSDGNVALNITFQPDDQTRDKFMTYPGTYRFCYRSKNAGVYGQSGSLPATPGGGALASRFLWRELGNADQR